MLSCFVAGLKWWIQFSSSVIMCLITSGSSSILFSHSWQISIQQSLSSQVRKWGTQQATTLRIFNFSCGIVRTDAFQTSRAWASCRTVMWQSSRTTAVFVFTISSVQMLNGYPTWGSHAAAVSLPLEKTLWQRLSKLLDIHHQCTLHASTSQSRLQISLTNNKILPQFSVHFLHPFSKVWICER